MEHLIELNLKHIFALLKEARFLKAMELYFHECVVIQEADEIQNFGKSNCIKIRRDFIENQLEELLRYDIGNYAICKNASFYDAIVEFKKKDGTTLKLEQAVATKWRDGKIFRERYYHTAIKRKINSLNMLKKDVKQEVSK